MTRGGPSTTLVAIGLNMLLLALIVFGYWQSEGLQWAWVLVGVPIVIVTITYVRHWLRPPQVPSGEAQADSSAASSTRAR